jgi:hypothetical protein
MLHDGHGNTWFYRGLEAGQRRIAETREEHVAAARSAFAAVAADLVAHGPFACRAGCAHCCHLPVYATGSEADAILAAIDGRPDAAALRARVLEEAAWRAEHGRTVTAQARRPCPLLDEDGRCRCYEQRPLTCRGLVSSDAEACAADRQAAAAPPSERPPLPVPYDGRVWAASRGVLEALERVEGEGGELVVQLATRIASPRDDAR